MKSLLRCGIALIAALLPAMSVQAQGSFPNKPVRLMVPYPAGGASDVLARLLAQKLSDAWSRPVVVDNRPGASGVIAADALAKSPADGHTLLLVINTHVINPSIVPRLPYDVYRDFAPVATFAASPFLLAVPARLPAATLQEFIGLLKTRPEEMNYGTIGSAGLGRVAGAMFGEAAGVPVRHVPYKGSAPLLTDLVGGRVEYVIDTPNVYLAQVKAGTVRPLAVTGGRRLAALPQVPTFGEQGLGAFDVRMWFGLLAPAGTPSETVQKIAGEVERITATPDFRDKLAAQEFEPSYAGPAAFAALLKADGERYARIVRMANIKEE